MKHNLRKTFNELRKLGAPVFDLGRDNIFVLSGEDNEARVWGDYYGEFNCGLPYIDPEAWEIAQDNGCGIEWADPGTMHVYVKE